MSGETGDDGMVMDRGPHTFTEVSVTWVARTKAERVAPIKKDKLQRQRMLTHHGRNGRGQKSVHCSIALKGERPLAANLRIGVAAEEPRLLPAEVRVECERIQTCHTRRTIINAQGYCSLGFKYDAGATW